VRLRWGEQWVDGVVIDEARSEGSVTVRVESPAGVFFPIVPRAAVAPIDPEPAELTAQFAAALAHRDPALASAWLASGLARGAVVDPALAAAVADWFVND
jgi:hypothetical protein